METKLKDLQEWCRKLGLATSGSKMRCLRRLQTSEFQIAGLYEESQREAIPLQVPKLPSRVEQDIHNLTHIPLLHGANVAWLRGQGRMQEEKRREETGRIEERV